MFHAWETFYLLIGTAAAALVGVMFIVTTLTAEISEGPHPIAAPSFT